MLTRERVIAHARLAGFDLCGIAEGTRHPRLARLASWIAEGRAGEMTYLADSIDERLDPARVLPTVRSIISLAVNYRTADPEADPISGAAPAIVARYARGDDYHDVLRARLRRLVAALAAEAEPGFEAFSCVDNGPVQERVFAEQAGLGWIGKHTCLINPDLGSWIFLAEIFTNAALEPDAPGVDHCGSCTQCLDACPTGAITAPYELDATRCLSYLTIETRGAVDPGWRASIGSRVYGCDICQDVCPWNRRAPASADPAWQARPALAGMSLVALCRLGDDEWRRLLAGSAMRRAGLRRIRRSLAYACATLRDADRQGALESLAAHPSSDHADVRDAMSWARVQAPGSGAEAAELPPGTRLADNQPDAL